MAKFAISEAERACTTYATASQLDVANIDASTESGTDDEIRGKSNLVFPLIVFAWPLSVRISMAAIAEHLTAELLFESSGNSSIDGQRKHIRVTDIALTIDHDEELSGLAKSLGKTDGRSFVIRQPDRRILTPEQRLVEHFPHTQIQLRELNHYAWYHHPSVVEEVLAQFISGELPPGDPALKKFHVRPIAYYGRNTHPMYFAPPSDRYDGNYSDSDGGYGMESLMDSAFSLVAFDLIDAAGREYPLLVEFRLGSRFYFPFGRVVDRRTSEVVGSIENTEHWCGEFELRSHTPFRNYASHHLTSDLFEGEFGQIYPEAQPPTIHTEGREQKMTVEFEIEALICVAIKKICCWGRNESFEELSRFQFMHPPAVISRFTNALYRTAFDSSEVKSTLASEFHLPNDLLRVIGEYAPVDLPYIPLDPYLGKASAQASYTSSSSDSSSNGTPSTGWSAGSSSSPASAASSSSSRGEKRAVESALGIDTSPSTGNGSPNTAKLQSGGDAALSSGVAAAASSASGQSSVATSNTATGLTSSADQPATTVIFPNTRWTDAVPASQETERFIAANGRTFNFCAFIEDKLAPKRKTEDQENDYDDE